MSQCRNISVLAPWSADRRALRWWRGLCVLAIVNVCAWLVAWRLGGSSIYATAHLYLSGVYVLVCAYRSVFPRVDLERLVVVDSGLSSIFIGRSAATVAEICFGLQLGLLVHQLGGQAGLPWVQNGAWVIPAFTAAAQLFCWHSVLTLNHITQALEEFLWALGLAWMAALLAVVALDTSGTVSAIAGIGMAMSIIFVAYVICVDIPMYVRRFRAGKAIGQKYLSVTQGVRDALERRVLNHDWQHWKSDAAWLTPYFSVGVWVSLSLVFVSGT